MNEALRELTRRADIKGYRLVLATVMERGDGVLAGGLATVERRECPFEARPYATLRWAVGDDGQAYFYQGHYDLDRGDALADHHARAGWSAELIA
jgi:hypothetical protein